MVATPPQSNSNDASTNDPTDSSAATEVKSQSARPKRPISSRPVKPAARIPSIPLKPSQIAGIVLAIVFFCVPLLIPLPGLDPISSRMLAIFLAAIMLWVTEAIPLYATSVLVIGAEVFLISNKAVFLPEGVEGTVKFSDFFATLADPVIILFLGGFFIADGAAKYGLDKALASVMLRPFLRSPWLTLAGLIGITAVLSMFMSNTATTATMFAMLMPVLAAAPPGKVRAGIALSIPVAANVGGIGTPVGTPPNAIAVGALAEKGIQISFVQWMIVAVPLMLVILLVAWAFIALYFIPRDTPIKIDLNTKFQHSHKAHFFYFVAALTITLWMTEPLHKVSSNMIGFIPVILLLVSQVMTGEDLKKIDWPVLWLVSGGIALGRGVGASGLDAWMLNLIDWNSMSPVWILLAMASVGFAMSNVISHSAASNLLIPLGIGLAGSLGTPATYIAVTLALGCSLGMSLPISTPPNAIAYATGEINTKYMAITGLVVGVFGTLLLGLAMPWFWDITGIL